MALELIECQTIDGNLGGRLMDNKVWQSLLGKLFYLKQLVDTVETAKPLAITGYLAGEVTAYARHAHQQRRVGGIEVDSLCEL